jgi:hypothetical protein
MVESIQDSRKQGAEKTAYGTGAGSTPGNQAGGTNSWGKAVGDSAPGPQVHGQHSNENAKTTIDNQAKNS